SEEAPTASFLSSGQSSLYCIYDEFKGIGRDRQHCKRYELCIEFWDKKLAKLRQDAVRPDRRPDGDPAGPRLRATSQAAGSVRPLYSAFMGPFVYCLLGTSKDASLAPPPSCRCSPRSYNAAPGVTSKSAVYAVLIVLRLRHRAVSLLGAMRLGVIVNFISLPVVSGFTTSAAVTIAWSQVKLLAIFSPTARSRCWAARGIFQLARAVCVRNLQDIGAPTVWDLTLGLSCMALLLVLMRDISKSVEDRRNGGWRCPPWCQEFQSLSSDLSAQPQRLIVACASLVAFSLKSVDLGDKLTLTQKVDSRLPPFPPARLSADMNGTQDIGIGFAVVPFIGLVESYRYRPSFRSQRQLQIDVPARELIAIALSNLAAALCPPTSGAVTGSVHHQPSLAFDEDFPSERK
uniref:Sulfate_transp domain-containing protein n=1 Tax=Macrostomum lignano TaxID=282301 RepID=A0A1I8JMS5_9PLAT